MSNRRLDASLLAERATTENVPIETLPIKILQIGEGNFIRGFFDWMVSVALHQHKYDGSIAVVQPRPTGKAKIDALAEQDGNYTLVTRGIEKGKVTERTEVISVFSKIFDPYTNWGQFLELAHLSELKIVVSNTTEAGLVYRPEPYIEDEPIQSYPGKLTALLYRRFQVFHGDPTKGLICLPCELLERNGDTLRQCVLQYCEDWQLPETFKTWIKEYNYFLNSLVDRIVTGYPKAELANTWFERWGYEDHMLTITEPYHLWAIEADDRFAKELPLAEAGLNVLWVNDLKLFQQRKIKILNGTHTFMALYGTLQGFNEVRFAIEDIHLGNIIRKMVEYEIIPTLPYDQAALNHYAQEVYDRFLNPFIQHRLSDIAMNSLSKFQTRLMPILHFHLERNPLQLPEGLTLTLASFLRYFKIVKQGEAFYGHNFENIQYEVRDDVRILDEIVQIWEDYHTRQLSLDQTIKELLSLEKIWGCSLYNQYPALVDVIVKQWNKWEA